MPNPMRPPEFVAALATIGLALRQYARMTDIKHEAMRHWGTIRVAIPEDHAEWLRRNVATRLADPPPRRLSSPAPEAES